MNSIWVIGDVHGEYDKLMKLLSQIPKNDTICFVGDLVDRGKNSAKVVDFVISNDYDCVLGNHELLMIEGCEDFTNKQLWKSNGGNKTIKSYYSFEYRFKKNTLKRDLKWMRDLPYFKYYEFEGYKPLVVSHSYIHGIWRGQEYSYSSDDIDTILWTHMYDENSFNPTKEEQNNIFNIFGHTVLKEPKITQNYANIDTGACFKNGKLSAVNYPSLEVISV